MISFILSSTVYLTNKTGLYLKRGALLAQLVEQYFVYNFVFFPIQITGFPQTGHLGFS